MTNRHGWLILHRQSKSMMTGTYVFRYICAWSLKVTKIDTYLTLYGEIDRNECMILDRQIKVQDP